MADIKETLKNVVKKFKRAQVVEPEGSRRMRKVQEAARDTSKRLESEKG